MRLSLHQLNVLLSIKQKMSISLAAKALHMTQPAVSNIVKQLEDLYQTKLTMRVNRQTQLTAAGLILSETAAKIQHLLREADDKIKADENLLNGKLSVAVVSTAKYFVPRLLAAFKRQHPSIRTHLTVDNRRNILNRLKQDLDDIVIMSQPPNDKRFIAQDFYDDKLVVAVSATSKLNRKKTYSISELINEDWLMRESGSGTRMAIEKLFKAEKITPNIISEVSNNESIKQLMIAGMGISIVSLQSIELELDNNLLTILPVKGFPKKHAWYMVKKQNNNANITVEAFDEFVDTHSDLAHFHSWKPKGAL
jgi:DNA-binding transcriptional LysR family regulator